MKKYEISAYSWGQRLVAIALLLPNYELLHKVNIVVEGEQNLKKPENFIYAMNYVNSFNYLPFQYYLWRKGYGETTVWVRGKYYRNPFAAIGLWLTNCIPAPSMGYFIEEFYKERHDRNISSEDYRLVKEAIDGKEGVDLKAVNKMLGNSCVSFFRSYHEQIMGEVARLTRSALFEKHLNLIIFPERIRSIKSSSGLTGTAQIALYTRKKVIPVACKNSEEIYPGASPVAKSGTVVYRIGKPLSVDGELAPFRIDEPFELLSARTSNKYEEQFSGATQLITNRINEMLA
jgi:1-acyl-sn-glycerol-3-phosphate acyltransferase